MKETIIYLSDVNISHHQVPPYNEIEVAIQFELQDENDPEEPTILLVKGSNPPILGRLSETTLCEIEKLLRGLDLGVEVFDISWG